MGPSTPARRTILARSCLALAASSLFAGCYLVHTRGDPGADGGGDAAGFHSGVVSFGQTASARYFSAFFAHVPLERFTSPCNVIDQSGTCRQVECTDYPVPNDAGRIDIADGDGPLLSSDWLAAGPASYGNAFGDLEGRTMQPPIADDAVSIHAAGGPDVPTFDTRVGAPSEFSMAVARSIDLSTELRVTWTPTNAETMEVRLSLGSARPASARAPRTTICTASTSEGAMTIPARFVGGIVDPGEEMVVAAVALDRVQLNVGEWSIAVDGHFAVIQAVSTH